MDIELLKTALKANAEKAHKPIAVEVAGVTIYVRRRTVSEFEQLAAVAEAGQMNGSGKFGPALARLLTDENGDRLPAEHSKELGHLLADQPESVFHQLLAAADGTADLEKAAAPGN